MTVIYLKEYNTRCYAVTFQSNESVTVQKFEDISSWKYYILYKTSGNIFRQKSYMQHDNNVKSF